jgi:hypothetical protein
VTIDVQDLLAKARWRQEINKRSYEGTMAPTHLSEALRTELRTILENDGKPFDLQVARHVYDFAIAAKDLLTVSVRSVEDAMRVVADNNGAMESLTGPNDPQPHEQVSETFGARMLRELLATLPVLLRKNNEDLHTLVGAIADAWSPAYREGYEAGRARRLSKRAHHVLSPNTIVPWTPTPVEES